MLEDPFQESEDSFIGAPESVVSAEPSQPVATTHQYEQEQQQLLQEQQQKQQRQPLSTVPQPEPEQQKPKKSKETRHQSNAPPMPPEKEKVPEKTPEEIEQERRQQARDVEANRDQIKFSTTYHDDVYAYRHVKLPKAISRWLPHYKPMKESEWRSLGVQQSKTWEHYMVHAPEPHILLFREPIDTYKARMREREKREQELAAAEQASEDLPEPSRPSKRQKAD
ncbi:CKS-domain-containing protein, partial [Lichtheimia hyalospora FSU 10163]